MAETSSLLNCRTGYRTGGSNPPASASFKQTLITAWRFHLTVRIQDSQSWHTGSIPVGATKRRPDFGSFFVAPTGTNPYTLRVLSGPILLVCYANGGPPGPSRSHTHFAPIHLYLRDVSHNTLVHAWDLEVFIAGFCRKVVDLWRNNDLL